MTVNEVIEKLQQIRDANGYGTLAVAIKDESGFREVESVTDEVSCDSVGVFILVD